MHSDKQIKDIQDGVRLLKLKKKKPLAVIENSNDSNASCFKRSESLKNSITPITEIRSQYLKILAEICDGVPFLDLKMLDAYKCKEMKPEEHVDALSQAVFHALFSSNKNFSRLAVEDKVNLSGRT